MKWLTFILVFSIFTQAHKVCVPGSCRAEKQMTDITISGCSTDDSGKKSCCHKKTKQDKEDQNHSCDGDTCHCLCCVKVFITSPSLTFIMKEWVESPAKKDKILAEKVHTSDFSKDFYPPPRLLA
ncbi:MAG: hypothetical protein IPN79_15970 [Saprospiraceae bacterium]|nr:hypothetical protein [Saprospiraceae bacterium]